MMQKVVPEFIHLNEFSAKLRPYHCSSYSRLRHRSPLQVARRILPVGVVLKELAILSILADLLAHPRSLDAPIEVVGSN